MFRKTLDLARTLRARFHRAAETNTYQKPQPSRHRLSLEPLEPRLALATDVLLYDSFNLDLHNNVSDGDPLDGAQVITGRTTWLADEDIVFRDAANDYVERTGVTTKLQAVVPFSNNGFSGGNNGFSADTVTVSALVRPLDPAVDSQHYAAIGILEIFELEDFDSDSNNFWFSISDAGEWKYREGSSTIDSGSISGFDSSQFHLLEVTFNDLLNTAVGSIDHEIVFEAAWNFYVNSIDGVGFELKATQGAVSDFQVRATTPSTRSLFGLSDTDAIKSLEGSQTAPSFPARDYGTLIFGPNTGFTDTLSGTFDPALTRQQVISRNVVGQWILADVTEPQAVMQSIGQWGPDDGWVDVQVGDFNGDGLSDILGRNLVGDWWAGITVLDAAHHPTLENHKLGHWGPDDGWTDVHVGDFNGDGLDDVIGRNVLGDWYVSLTELDSSGNPQFGAVLVSNWSRADGFVDILVADVNGDAVDDIVGRNAFGTWYAQIFEKAAPGVLGTTSIAQLGAWGANDGWVDVQIADLNGDGASDILGRNVVGDWYGGITQLSPDPTLDSVKLGHWGPDDGWVDVRVGDYNGDGLDDVAGRNVIGDWWYSKTEAGPVEFADPVSVANWDPDTTWRSVESVPNGVPTIIAPTDLTLPADQISQIPISATDPDGDFVHFNPDGDDGPLVTSTGGTGTPIVKIQSNSILTIDPNGATGEFKVRIRANDGQDQDDETVFFELEI